MPAAILEREGVEVDLIDMVAEQLSYSQALERVRQFNPELLGFTLSSFSFRTVLAYIKEFKKDTELPILIGGVHLNMYASETMSHQEIDYAIVGECEIPLPQFIRAYRNGKNFDQIPSICYRDKQGNAIINTKRQTVDNLDDLPYPARHLIKNEKYSNILTRRNNFTAMLSSRGCPYRCTFCDQKNPPYRYRSARSVLDEIVFNYEHHGIQEFDMYDSTFTANRKRVLELCQLIRESGLDVGWSIRSTIMAMTNEMLDSIASAGCHIVMYGIETSNKDIKRTMRKMIPIERVRERVQHTY